MHAEPGFFAEPRNWVVLAFILFFVLFGKKLWTPLAAMLDARADAVKAELEEAQTLRREADAMLKDAEKQREEAVKDAKALIDGAKAEAGRITAAAAAEAEASAKRREKMAIDRIAAAEKAAVDDVRLAAADIATVAARQVLTEDLTLEADGALIDHAISQLPSALATTRHAA
jgi:F-type H+-transporting ATPase subunit b